MKIRKSNIFFFILGAIIFSCISVFATLSIAADQIEYAPNVSVKDKIDDLYTKVKPNYSGSYSVTPSSSEQTLSTSNKILTNNITVSAIPNSYKQLSVNTTATASDIISGKTAYDNNGNLITGSATLFSLNTNNLNLYKHSTTISATVGKQYIIFISVTSYINQSYKPSIISGCTINKTVGQISNSWDTFTTYANAYIVTATSNTITLQGNTADTNWNFIGYYEL